MTANTAPHMPDKKRRNRRQIAWTLALVTITVLAMTLYDVRFRSDHARARAPATYYYVSSDADLALVPDDNSGLTIWQGLLKSSQKDGQVVISGDPVAPTNLPQRQIELQFTLMPLAKASEDEVVRTIGRIANGWVRKNNLVMDILLDVRALDSTQLAALDRLITRINREESPEYRFTLTIDPLAAGAILTGIEPSARDTFLQRIYSLNIDVTADTAAAAIAATDRLGRGFTVTIPADADPAHFAGDASTKAKHFKTFIRKLGPAPAVAPRSSPR